MQERSDHTEPVEVLDAAGNVLARASCRYSVAADGWHGMLSDIRPTHALHVGAYSFRFPGGSVVPISLTAFSPRDLRRAYFSGSGPPPA